MSDQIPAELLKAHRYAESTIADARKNLRTMLSVDAGWARFLPTSVATLKMHAVEIPNIRALADFLCEMTPAAFLKAEFDAKGLTVKAVSDGLAKDMRMLKLRSLVIESGLAEQLTPDGSFREGATFSAEKLEKSLDDWLQKGRHRGGDYDSAPLSHVDKTISAKAESAEDVVRIRLGLLIPVVSSIHIWRILEQYPSDVAKLLGWQIDAANPSNPEAAGNGDQQESTPSSNG